jgi:protein tyrosine phosphatase
MPFIENIAYIDAVHGDHKDPGPNSLLIQITEIHVDSCPIPKFNFKEVKKFAFMDVEEGDDLFEDFGIKDEDGESLSALLKRSLAEDMNVIVHCFAGLCRSGAVVECGVILGFKDTGRVRKPNIAVKNMILKHLQLDFNPDESPFNEKSAAPLLE